MSVKCSSGGRKQFKPKVHFLTFSFFLFSPANVFAGTQTAETHLEKCFVFLLSIFIHVWHGFRVSQKIWKGFFFKGRLNIMIRRRKRCI